MNVAVLSTRVGIPAERTLLRVVNRIGSAQHGCELATFTVTQHPDHTDAQTTPLCRVCHRDWHQTA